MGIQEALRKLVNGEVLDAVQIGEIFNSLMEGELTEGQIGALLGILAMRTPRVQELVGAAKAMRKACVKIKPATEDSVDTCGTGGDRAGTFNISTCTALVAAAGGAEVPKHGNRSATSQCGGADLLEAMGWDLDAEPDKVEACLKQTGFTFLFARKMHPAMRHVAPVRAALGIRTIFNFLGPLSNPAGAPRQLVGISDSNLMGTYARALAELGAKAAMVVSSHDGLDEISLCAPTDVVELHDGEFQERTISPEDFGLTRCEKGALTGGTVEENVRITEEILRDKQEGPKQDAVLINAGAALYIAGKASDIQQGVQRSRELIASGAAWAKVQEVMQAIRA